MKYYTLQYNNNFVTYKVPNKTKKADFEKVVESIFEKIGIENDEIEPYLRDDNETFSEFAYGMKEKGFEQIYIKTVINYDLKSMCTY